MLLECIERKMCITYSVLVHFLQPATLCPYEWGVYHIMRMRHTTDAMFSCKVFIVKVKFLARIYAQQPATTDRIALGWPTVADNTDSKRTKTGMGGHGWVCFYHRFGVLSRSACAQLRTPKHRRIESKRFLRTGLHH